MWKNSERPALWPIKRKKADDRQRAPDYRFYSMGVGELLQNGMKGMLLIVLLAWFFYRSLWAVIPLFPLLVLFLKKKESQLADRRRKELAGQFRDAILAAAAGLQAGYSMENAFAEAGRDVSRLYGQDSIMAREFDIIQKGLHNHIPLEELLMDLGRRSGEEDVEDFAEVFSIARRAGGNMNEIIRRSARMTGDKIEIKREIQTMLASRKYEQKIMNMIPFLIIAYLQVTSSGFFDCLYGNAAGILIMTGCLAVYLAAVVLSEKIVEIEV